MRIRLRTLLDVAELRPVVERRLRFALSRFEPRILSVDLTLRDVNGPRGGLDRYCRLVVRLSWPKSRIVVEAQDLSLESSVSRCAERAARTVARALEASREGRRSVLTRQNVA